MRFRVKGIRGASEVAVLPIEAVNEEEASAAARRQGYDVISVRREGVLGVRAAAGGRPFPLIRFSQELIALLRAGLTVVEAIAILHRKEASSPLKSMLADVLTKLRQGMKFSSALEAFPLVFPVLYVAAVRAAERTGAISDALARFVDYQLQVDKVRSKVVSASIYPALLLTVGALVTLFLLGYVVPRFSRIYQDFGDRLPFFSRWLMEAGQLVDRHGEWVCTGMAGLAVAAYCVAVQPAVRNYGVRSLWRVPVVRSQRRVYELAQFYRSMSMLLRSGLPIVPALDMSKGLLSVVLRENLEKAAQEIREGRSLSEAMDRHGLATPIAHSMIVVAERGGNMSDMLDVVAAFHEEELARWVDWFTRLFEPVLMAVIGIVIGLIVVFMYMPIFELAETIQ